MITDSRLMERAGKARAGRMLDGVVEHNGFPERHTMLEMLHVVELSEIAGRHRLLASSTGWTHEKLVSLCNNAMTGREIVAATCRALRARHAFAAGSDAPISENSP
jgi:hypothetical protein